MTWNIKSRSPRSVWVEIKLYRELSKAAICHAPHGACELKCSVHIFKTERNICHAPHGACELKFVMYLLRKSYISVTLPTERVSWNFFFLIGGGFSPGHAPHGACELKLDSSLIQFKASPSRSPRSVWVEISFFLSAGGFPRHAPHGACELKFFIVFSVVFVGVVTLPTERVSWNNILVGWQSAHICHAPHGACELKV